MCMAPAVEGVRAILGGVGVLPEARVITESADMALNTPRCCVRPSLFA